MTNPGRPYIERLLAWLVIAVIGLHVLADVLPRLVVPIAVLAGLVMALRLVWYRTGGW
jgi:hypothetical protein